MVSSFAWLTLRRTNWNRSSAWANPKTKTLRFAENGQQPIGHPSSQNTHSIHSTTKLPKANIEPFPQCNWTSPKLHEFVHDPSLLTVNNAIVFRLKNVCFPTVSYTGLYERGIISSPSFYILFLVQKSLWKVSALFFW